MRPIRFVTSRDADELPQDGAGQPLIGWLVTASPRTPALRLLASRHRTVHPAAALAFPPAPFDDWSDLRWPLSVPCKWL